MTAKYYTVCAFEIYCDKSRCGDWFDACGFTSMRDAKEEAMEYASKFPRSHVCIVANDGTSQDMIAKRDALPAPRGYSIARA